MGTQKKMNSIYEEENEIFNQIKSTIPESEQASFVMDGLCWADIQNGENLSKDIFLKNENLYLSQKHRIVFLCKESNNNPG